MTIPFSRIYHLGVLAVCLKLHKFIEFFLAVQYRALMYFNSFHMLELSCLSIASIICNLGLLFLNKCVLL